MSWRVSSTNDVPHNIPKQWEAYFHLLVNAAEQAGILVMRSGIVGNDTYRKLDVEKFRGFALVDPLAPVVFINSADAPSARLFTSAHELAHLWIGKAEGTQERFCNAVAGEFLAPEALAFAEVAEHCATYADTGHESKCTR